MQVRESTPGALEWIFARGTESQDALAFDPSQVDDHGEMAEPGRRGPAMVVAASAGARAHASAARRGGANGTNLYYLWTNLWLSWPHTSSVHSRGFVPKHGQVVHAREVKLFARSRDVIVHRFLSEPLLAHVDVYFAQALEATMGQLAIVLTDAPAEGTAEHDYSVGEPHGTRFSKSVVPDTRAPEDAQRDPCPRSHG